LFLAIHRKINIDSNWSPRTTPKQAYKFDTVTPNDVAVLRLHAQPFGARHSSSELGSALAKPKVSFSGRTNKGAIGHHHQMVVLIVMQIVRGIWETVTTWRS